MPFPNKSTQFKKGQSGNKTGRPPGAKNFATRLFEAIEDQIWFLDTPPRIFVRAYVRLYLKDKKRIKKHYITDCFESFLIWKDAPKRKRQINR